MSLNKIEQILPVIRTSTTQMIAKNEMDAISKTRQKVIQLVNGFNAIIDLLATKSKQEAPVTVTEVGSKTTTKKV